MPSACDRLAARTVGPHGAQKGPVVGHDVGAVDASHLDGVVLAGVPGWAGDAVAGSRRPHRGTNDAPFASRRRRRAPFPHRPAPCAVGRSRRTVGHQNPELGARFTLEPPRGLTMLSAAAIATSVRALRLRAASGLGRCARRAAGPARLCSTTGGDDLLSSTPPTSPRLEEWRKYTEVGVALYRQGNLERAEACLNRAIDVLNAASLHTAEALRARAQTLLCIVRRLHQGSDRRPPHAGSLGAGKLQAGAGPLAARRQPVEGGSGRSACLCQPVDRDRPPLPASGAASGASTPAPLSGHPATAAQIYTTVAETIEQNFGVSDPQCGLLGRPGGWGGELRCAALVSTRPPPPDCRSSSRSLGGTSPTSATTLRRTQVRATAPGAPTPPPSPP